MIGPIGLTIVALACGLAGFVLGMVVTFCLLVDEQWPRKRVDACDPFDLRYAGRKGRDV